MLSLWVFLPDWLQAAHLIAEDYCPVGVAISWAGTGWGVSRPLPGLSSPFCSDSVSGCSRACRVSACHSWTRSVGVFPAWKKKMKKTIQASTAHQKLLLTTLVVLNWRQMHRGKDILHFTTRGCGCYWYLVGRGLGCCITLLQCTGKSLHCELHGTNACSAEALTIYSLSAAPCSPQCLLALLVPEEPFHAPLVIVLWPKR